MSYNKLFITITMLMLIFAACRKEWTATEEDMTNYGWTLFEQASLMSFDEQQKEYENVLDWFENATKKDTNYQDGYNGMGWTYGKLSIFEIDDDDLNNAIDAFLIAEGKTQNPRIDHNVWHDILAGLTFAYSALKDDSMAIVWGDSLLSEIGKDRVTWVFPHEPVDIEGNYPTDYLDVHITLALAKFVRSTTIEDFNDSEYHVDAIILAKKLPDFDANYETIVGQEKLAAKIQELQEYLK
jgi:tetratricopeptide (TPR) repeat protein